MLCYINFLSSIILLCAISECGSVSRRLNNFIKHYEVLDYDPGQVHDSHSRVKRWLQSYEDRYTEEPSIAFKFNAHSRHFHLRLKRDTETFSHNINLENDSSFSPHDAAHLFTGHLDGVRGSYVHGSVVRGVFAGKVVFPDETFYLERSWKYFPASADKTFHSIIYSEKDLEHSVDHHLGHGQDQGCGANSSRRDWMTRFQNSEIMSESDFRHKLHNSEKFFSPNIPFDNGEDFQFLNGTNVHNRLNALDHSFTISRRKRDILVTTSAKGNERSTCTLHIRTDPMLWKQVAKQQDTEDKTSIREEILSIIGHHVKAANEIFSNTLFKWNDEMFKNIRFVVQTVKIDTDEECDPNYNGTVNPFCASNIDVSNFLEIHSRSNHDAFCLSYAFTYRDFTGGVIGLAWVASLSASGGICQRSARYFDSATADKYRSLNTGIVTFLNYGRHLPSRLSELTFTHELGHNFGAPHDPDECQPGGNKGNYVMYASSTNGYLPNNVEFSECSVKSISEVLDQAFNSVTRPDCFIATDGAFCGNQLVEDGEECDCGFDSNECKDNCCYPRMANPNDFPGKTPSGALSCKRKPPAKCSPSEGPCCQAKTCQFSTKADHRDTPCLKESECSEDSYCSGTSPQCPIPKFKANYTECNKGSQVCIDGECRGSICLKFGLAECFLSSAEYADKRELCKIACVDGNGFCKPTSELGVPEIPANLSLRPGSPCDNFKGYCDVFQKCRAVNERGPLLRLKRLFFNRSAYKGLWDWCRKNWWGVTLMAIGFVILMGLFIKCCAVHTKSSNPNRAPALKFGETIRRPLTSLKKQHRPPRSREPPGYGATGGDERIPMEPRYP